MTPTATPDVRDLKSFAEFYPFYLGEHRNRYKDIWSGKIRL